MTGGAILTAAQMRAAEQAAFDAGVDPHDLMEQAGAAAAEGAPLSAAWLMCWCCSKWHES